MAYPRASSAASPASSTRQWKIVEGLDIDEFSRARIDASVAELTEERDTVAARASSRARLAVK